MPNEADILPFAAEPAAICSTKSLLAVQTILPIELINTPACLGSLLLAGIERVALGTDLNVNILLRRTCDKGISTVARYRCLIIIRMDSFSHLSHLAYDYF